MIDIVTEEMLRRTEFHLNPDCERAWVGSALVPLERKGAAHWGQAEVCANTD